MQTQSPVLRRALVDGRQWITNTVEVIEGGAGPSDPALAILEPDAGGVGLDETRASRRTCTGLHLGINDRNADLIPGPVGDLLHPATGNELRIRSGRKFGRTNLVPDRLAFPGKYGSTGPWNPNLADNVGGNGNVVTSIGSMSKGGHGSLVVTNPAGGYSWLEAVSDPSYGPTFLLSRGQQFWAVAWVMPLGTGMAVTFGVDGDSWVTGMVTVTCPPNVWTPIVVPPQPFVTTDWGGAKVGGASLVIQIGGAPAGSSCAFDGFGVFSGGTVDAERPFAPQVEDNAAGVFRFDKLPVADSAGALSMTVAGLDRAFALSQHRWTDTFHLPRQTLILDGIRRIVANRWTGKRPLIVDTTACADHPILEMTVPNSVFGTDQTNTDPYADLTALATAGACELLLDEVGRLVVRPFVDPSKETAAASYTEGVDCTMVDLTREIDPTRTFSGIVVTGGSGTDRACRAVVWNLNPASPTYVGKVGYIAAFYDSPLLRTNGQCQLVGEGLLKRLQLSSEVVTFTATPNPGLEGADAVYLDRQRAKATGIYGVSNYNLPLDMVSTMTLTTRSTTDIPGHSIT